MRLPLQVRDLGSAALAEHLEVLDDLFVLDVQEVLMEGVRRGHRRVEPDGSPLGLAELRAVGLGEQGCAERVYPRAFDSSDQLDSGRDVAPLIAAPELQRAAVVAEELQVIHRLQQHVGELGVGDALFQPVPHHVASQHPIDREVLADVAQEVEHWHRPCPVKVVDDPCGVLPREVDKTLDLPPNAFHPGGHRLFGVEDPLAGLFWITDQSGRSADQNQGMVPGIVAVPEPPSAAQGCRSADWAPLDQSRHKK